jgi:hypothetical protein
VTGVAATPADDDHRHPREEDPESEPAVVVPAWADVVEVLQQSGGEHQAQVHDYEVQEPNEDQEMQ